MMCPAKNNYLSIRSKVNSRNANTRNANTNNNNNSRINVRHTDINETLLKPIHKFYLNNFKTYRNDRFNHGDGVAICVNKNIRHELLAVYNTSSIENISVAVFVNDEKIILTSAYNPRYTSSFSNDIEKMTLIDKQFIVLGDLNAKNTAWNCVSNNTAGNLLINIQHRRIFFHLSQLLADSLSSLCLYAFYNRYHTEQFYSTYVNPALTHSRVCSRVQTTSKAGLTT